MKNIYCTVTLCLFVFSSSLAFAGVLQQEWTEGTKRYCKYSNGEVIAISYGSTCPRTN
jgi:hypothetical protein